LVNQVKVGVGRRTPSTGLFTGSDLLDAKVNGIGAGHFSIL
jgi:hypothetical protein